MIIQTSYNLNFAIFPDEKFDQEKIISERLNKTPNFENTNHKLFLNQNHKETIFNDEFEQSGYYLYDEQFLRLNGVRHYRLTLFNAILKVPVTERIVCRRIPKNLSQIQQINHKLKVYCRRNKIDGKQRDNIYNILPYQLF